MRLRGELPKEEEEEEEDWDPEPILACCYAPDGSGRFLITSQGQFAGYYYICDFGVDRPLKAIEILPETLCRIIEVSPSGDIITLAFDNGDI